MARMSKFCPACQAKQPVQLRVECVGPPPTTQVRYVATCQTCQQDIPPDLVAAKELATKSGRALAGKLADGP